MNERQKLEAAIESLEQHRAVVGEVATDAALAPIRARLSAVIDQQRSLRQVCVLFADLVGSTSISQTLDPEEIHAVLDGSLARLTKIVKRHEGVVLQYAGDSLLAVFGNDHPREDDAARAVACALAITKEAEMLAAELLVEHGVRGLGVRVGVHTGTVMLGGGLDEPSTIRGVTVNLAARLEQAAPVGCVRISQDTQRHVAGLFEVVEQPPLAVKGFASEVRSFLVTRSINPVKPGLMERAARPATRLVGRKAELGRLHTAWTRVPGHAARSVLVAGEAGVGKSRLIAEFADSLPNEGAYPMAVAHAQPYGFSLPYGLLRDLIESSFGVLENDSASQARSKIASGLARQGREVPRADVDALCTLVGIGTRSVDDIHVAEGSGKAIRDQAFQTLLRYIGSQCDAGGGLVLFEDLHWADDGSLDFVDYLLQQLEHRFLLVASCRPDLFDRRSPAFDEVLELGPLGRTESRSIVRELLTDLPAVPDALRDLVVNAAEGNPYFIEELIGMLSDEGVLVRETTGQVSVDATRLLATKIPSTLTGVLQARLSSLSSRELATLQAASVIGNVFWDEALDKLGVLDPNIVEVLVGRRLASPSPISSILGSRQYRFNHHLLHRTAYETLPRRVRQEQHRLTAQWLIERAGDRMPEHYAVIADHFERAGEVEPAVRYLEMAAAAAAESYALDAVLHHCDRAIALTRDLPKRFDLSVRRILTLIEKGVSSEDRDSFERLVQMARELDDEVCQARAAGYLTTYHAMTGDLGQTRTVAGDAIRLGLRSGDTASVIRAYNQLGRKLADAGQLDEALQHLEKGQSLSRQHGNWSGEVSALNKMSEVALQRGQYLEALSLDLEAANIARAQGDRPFVWSLDFSVASLRTLLGQHAAAEDALLKCLDQFSGIGWSQNQALIAIMLARNSLWRDQPDEASRWMVRADGLCPRSVPPDVLRIREKLRGDILLATGDIDEAIPCYVKASAACGILGLPEAALEGRICQAAALHRKGNLEAAGAMGQDFKSAIEKGVNPSTFSVDSCGLLLHAEEVFGTSDSANGSLFVQLALSEADRIAAHLPATDRFTFWNASPSRRRLAAMAGREIARHA